MGVWKTQENFSEHKFFEEWDQDLCFLVISRVVSNVGYSYLYLSLQLQLLSPLSHTLYFPYYTELLLISPIGHAFHHLSPPMGDTVDCLPNNPTGSFAFFLANRIPILFRYGASMCLEKVSPSPSSWRLSGQNIHATPLLVTGLGWVCDHFGQWHLQWHRELLQKFVLCYLEKHWEASPVPPFLLWMLSCEGIMECQPPCGRAEKTKRIKNPT